MMNLYKELSLNASLTSEEILAQLKTMLAEARKEYASASSQKEFEQSEDKIILLQEAMRVFASEESKESYDSQLQAELSQSHEEETPKRKENHLSNKELKKIMFDAIDEEDWGQALSIGAILEERRINDNGYYCLMVLLFTGKNDLEKALSLLEEGIHRNGDVDAQPLLYAGVDVGIKAIAENNIDLALRCNEFLFAHKEQMDGYAEILDMLCDLAQEHYPIFVQKANSFVLAYPNNNKKRELLCQFILDHIEESILSRTSNGEEFFASEEKYQIYKDLMKVAIAVTPDKKAELQSTLDRWEKKELIHGAKWGLAGYIIYGLICLLAPGGYPFLGALLLILGGVTYYMLKVPMWQANFFSASGRLYGINNVFRMMNTVIGWLIYGIFRFYKFIFSIIFG